MTTRKEHLLNSATIVVTLLAAIVGGYRLWELFLRPDPNAPRTIPNWDRYAQHGHRRGSRDAAVTVVEFADFQCPYCRHAADGLQEILERFPNDVALVFRHYPLQNHEYALPAAQAAECAAAQGAFWRYHDLLFAQADSIGHKSWVGLAEEAHVSDLAMFEGCIRDNPAIDRDTLAGNAIGITGTPLLLVNELRIVGYPGAAALEEYVVSALKRTGRD